MKCIFKKLVINSIHRRSIPVYCNQFPNIRILYLQIHIILLYATIKQIGYYCSSFKSDSKPMKSKKQNPSLASFCVLYLNCLRWRYLSAMCFHLYYTYDFSTNSSVLPRYNKTSSCPSVSFPYSVIICTSFSFLNLFFHFLLNFDPHVSLLSVFPPIGPICPLHLFLPFSFSSALFLSFHRSETFILLPFFLLPVSECGSPVYFLSSPFHCPLSPSIACFLTSSAVSSLLLLFSSFHFLRSPLHCFFSPFFFLFSSFQCLFLPSTACFLPTVAGFRPSSARYLPSIAFFLCSIACFLPPSACFLGTMPVSSLTLRVFFFHCPFSPFYCLFSPSSDRIFPSSAYSPSI